LQAYAWLARQAGPAIALAALALFLFVGYGWRAWRAGRIPSAWLLIGAVGGAGLALELYVVTAYQCARGNLWEEIGLLFAAYLAGLGLGSRLAQTAGARLPLVFAWGGLAMLCAAGFAGIFIGQGNTLLALGWLLAGGTCAGWLYARLVQGQTAAAAAKVWSADLAGGMLGALAATPWLLPWLGVYAGLPFALGLALTALAYARSPVPAGGRTAR
jgi:hypothetical protein